MSEYYMPGSVEELRQRAAATIPTLQTDDDYAALYGKDLPRFLGADAQTHSRPTSRHLHAPLYQDAQGRQYQAADSSTGSTNVFWVRIPPSLSARANAALRKGDKPDPADVVDFPLPGELVQLSPARSSSSRKDGASVILARVHNTNLTNATASCQVVFEEAVPTDYSAEQVRRLEARAQRKQDSYKK